MVLVTACADSNPREGVDFLPLTCDYKENSYASGRIPGGFFKREGKPPEKEVLTSRLIDRPIRPMFPDGWRNETQIIALVISADTDNDSDVLAITGASAALALSSIPQTRTLAGVRVGFADGDFVINPTFEQRKRSTLDLIVAGSRDGIVMVEAGAKEVPEPQMVEALERAHAAIKEIVAGIDALAAQAGKAKRAAAPKKAHSGELVAEVEGKVLGPLADAMRIKDKLENYATVDKVINDYLAAIYEEDLEIKTEKKLIAKGLKEKILRDEILGRGQRLDGRKFDEIRKITIEVGVLPRTHGSCLFTRGETQALVVATLGTAGNELNGKPVIILTSLGAKSGKLRKTPLMRVEHDGEYAVVASLGGAPKHPVWYYNLTVNPHVELQDGPAKNDYTAREVQGAERDAWWARAVAAWPDYAQYQKKTTRVIPVFVLTPAAA